MLRTLRLNRLGGLSRAFGTIPLAGRVVGAVVIVAVVSASLAGFVAYGVADGNGYDRGFEVGKTQGFDEGKDAGFKDGNAVGLKQSQAKYSEGYTTGKSAGYDDGYNKATSDAIEVIKEKAYVGGKRFDNLHGNIVDFLGRIQSTGAAVLIEIIPM